VTDNVVQLRTRKHWSDMTVPEAIDNDCLPPELADLPLMVPVDAKTYRRLVCAAELMHTSIKDALRESVARGLGTT